MASVSAFDMLDDVTLTRQAGQVGSGQMIWSFETLAAGGQVLCRMHLVPFTPELTAGALLAAVETYLREDATIGGQAARGFGFVRGEWLTAYDLAAREAYESYLAENREALGSGLRDGTLGMSKVICRI
jgi:CRISPR/Cas system CSM-associated protein Csm3 (group 7 of RAMP superfamily)